MTPPPRYRLSERVALISLLVTVGLVVLKSVVWAATSSLAVASQALDSVLDLVALGLVFLGVRLANKPADESHHYGHTKAENLAAFAQTLLIGLVVVFIGFESILRLGDENVEVSAPWYALALIFVSVIVDGARVFLLLRTARAEGSEALKAGALNIAGDVGTAIVTLISLGFVRAGVQRADAIGALVVAGAVAVAAVRIGRRSVDVLMDRAPAARVAAIEAAVANAPGVEETRRVRVRDSGGQVFADITVSAGRTHSLERAHDITESIEREVQRVSPGADVVVHVEPERSTSGLVERVGAAASRMPDVHEVHNISVHAFDDSGVQRLHVTLHAKVAPTASLSDAHDIADRLEGWIAEELGSDVRVDAHIEPLAPTAHARDVTGQRPDVVTAVTECALEEVEIEDCHEVIVTATGGDLSVVAHVTGRGALALSKMHDASRRVENNLHARFPELGSVLLHFEPR